MLQLLAPEEHRYQDGQEHNDDAQQDDEQDRMPALAHTSSMLHFARQGSWRRYKSRVGGWKSRNGSDARYVAVHVCYLRELR